MGLGMATVFPAQIMGRKLHMSDVKVNQADSPSFCDGAR
jgi:hypothetical protein